MAFGFDNLDDVMGKFNGTICYYDGKPVMVKSAMPGETEKEFLLIIAGATGRGKTIKLEDKAFNYRDYNIGYVNSGTIAPWWFRKPMRQYKQGLKKDQMGWRFGTPGAMLQEHFGFSRPFLNMLENAYPNREQVKKHLMGGEMNTMAFHRDFAVSYDAIHEDYILEHRGVKVGTSIGGNLNQFKLIEAHKHLAETVQEAIG